MGGKLGERGVLEAEALGTGAGRRGQTLLICQVVQTDSQLLDSSKEPQRLWQGGLGWCGRG